MSGKSIIKNGRLFTVCVGVIEGGDVLIEDGRIAAVGRELAVPENAQVFDASGLIVTPGLIDTHSHMGLDEWGNWQGINELNEIGDPVTAQLRGVDGFYHRDRAIREAAAAGITSMVVHTGSIQLFSGQSFAFKTKGDAALEEMLIDGCIGIKGGFGGTPKRFYNGVGGFPATRMGEAYLLRKTLAAACDYRDGKGVKQDGLWDEEEKLKALQPLLRGEIPWRVHVYKLYDILTCLRIAKEFGLQVVLEHGGESPLIAEQLAALGVYVTVGPSGFIGSVKPETFYSVMDHVNRFIEAGVVFGFQSDHPIIHSASLPRAVGMYVRRGLSEERALEAMTINGARIIGCADRLGSIEVGKDADLVIASGSVFDPATVIHQVLIDGIPQLC